jgi:hypothetical protein
MMQLDDDGKTVTLDLHGLTVDEALAVTRRTLDMAEARGRATLKLIHGHSTSGAPGRRTIKTALHNALDGGFLQRYQTNHHRTPGTLTLSLGLGQAADAARIRSTDVWPP